MNNKDHITSAPPPRLRGDLIIGLQKSGEKSYVVIKDPDSGEFYRFNDAEHFVARQLNGDTPLDVVRQRAEEKFGAPLSEDILDAFVGKLDRIGLLETGRKKKKKRDDHRRFRGNSLYLRYKIIDPNRLLNRMIDKVRFFFTPHFALFSAGLILLAVITTISNWGEFSADLSNLFRVSSVPLLLIVTFFVVSLHEFAHGLTCKHFGGDVHEMGFMLIYFQPALYCNVSDAWLFPEKWKRLLVGFAGPYFELFVWALATMSWRFTSNGSLVNDLSLIVMATSGIKTLFNFNPFIKYDGYYLLSDYLEIPNLRRKSFRYVGDSVKRLLGINVAPDTTLSRRERRLYLFYGIPGIIGTAMFLSFVVVLGGDLFLNGNEVLAALLFGLAGMRLRRRFRKLFGKRSATASAEEEDEPESPAEGSENAGTEKKSRAGNTTRKKFWLAAAALLLIYLFVGTMQLRIAGPFAILPVHNADVRAEIEGIVQEIRVTEGDEVREGEIIAVLSGREDRAELEKTRAAVEQARARLKMLIAGPTAEEIRLARAAVAKAADRLKFAEARSNRNKELFEKSLIPKTEYETTLELATVGKNELTEAQERLNVLLRGTRREEIEGARAEVSKLEAQQHYLEGQLSRTEVRSPVTGTVATPARQLKEMERQLVAKGALIAKVFDMKRLVVEIPVEENEIADIRVGNEVAFKARAYPGETFHGRVTSIAAAAREAASNPSGGSARSPLPGLPSGSAPKTAILVTTEIDNSSLLLKPGMTGEAKIFCGERRIIELIIRRIALTVGVEFWSWW